MSADCPTCRLMDDGLPCEYHRGLVDGAAERDALAAKIEALLLTADRPTLDSATARVNARALDDLRAALKDHP